MTAPGNKGRKAFLSRLLAVLLLVNGVVAATVWQAVRRSRAEHETRARDRADNLSLLLSEDITGIFEKAGLGLMAASDEIEMLAARQFTGKMDIGEFLAKQEGRIPELDAFRFADAGGTILYGKDIQKGSTISIADREYFTRLRDDPHAGLVTSRPMLGRVSHRWGVYLARRCNRPDGSFYGVVYAVILLDRFTDMFARLSLGPKGMISLRSQDFELLARFPPLPGKDQGIGGTGVSPQFLEIQRRDPGHGSYVGTAGADGVRRRFSYRRTRTYQGYVVAGLADADYLRDWHREAANSALVVSLFFVGSLVLGYLVWRAWRIQMASAEDLAREEEKFHTIADYTYDWEYWEGADHELLFMSPSCEGVTGYTAAEFMADPELLMRVVHPDDRPLMRAHRSDVRLRDEARLDFRITSKQGEPRWISHGCRPVFGRDGKHLGRRASNRDITERVLLTQELGEMARTDALTGLANRRAFSEAAEKEFLRGRRFGSDASVLMLDVDHFKQINDAHGHEAGDLALAALAATLKAMARATDLPARFGGEEFVFLLVGARLAGAVELAERIRTEVAQVRVPGSSGAFGFTVSIGAASFMAGDAAWSDAVRRADQAMYQAKRSGRNLVVADPGQLSEV